MAVRKCPQCLAVISAGHAVAYSDRLECPGCHAPLEVSAGSRMFATVAGLLAAALVWRLTAPHGGMLGWVLSVVYAFLGYAVVSPLALMLMADLRNRAPEPVYETPQHSPGHGGGHH